MKQMSRKNKILKKNQNVFRTDKAYLEREERPQQQRSYRKDKRYQDR